MSTITPKELAEACGCDPKMVRKFLRSITSDRANKGGRWAIDSADVPRLVERYNSWRKGRTVTFTLED
jgi:hypothetical protein